MVVRYDLTEDFAGAVDITPVPDSHEGRYVSYEDYKALKTHADAMCEAMCLYDLGERVSFEPYINYTEWLSSGDDV